MRNFRGVKIKTVHDNGIMALRFSCPLGFAVAVIFCVLIQRTSQATTGAQFSCYKGSLTSNERGQIPLNSERLLSPQPCEGAVTLTTSQPRNTTVPDIPGRNGTDNTSQQPPTPVTTAQPPNVPADYMCVYKYFPTDSKVTSSVKWTANFSCMPTAETCPIGMSCCNTSNCNTLQYFMQARGVKIVTVDSCFKGSSDNTSSQVAMKACEGSSHFCYNRTTREGVTRFGCSLDNKQKACQNITVDGTVASMCVKDNGTSLCCCTSDDCNAPPQNTSSHPTHTVPTTTRPYLVTAGKPTSNWTLVLFIAAGVLIGGLVGVALLVLCRRWKKKRDGNAPLSISYSRVSTDCPNEDDDNIFSY